MDSEDSPGLPAAPRLSPYYFQVRANRSYLWCSCGLSKRQPFCDLSHLGTGFEPVPYRAEADGEVLFCGCKQTGEAPFCDGTHSNLAGGYQHDDPDSPQNAPIPWVERDAEGISRLDGACYAITPDATRPLDTGAYWSRVLVSPAGGSIHQTAVYLAIDGAASPALSGGASDVLLWIAAGEGEVAIGDRTFPARAQEGIHVRAGERVRLTPASGRTLRVFAFVCPAADLLETTGPDGAFDEAWSVRVGRIDEVRRQKMGDRYFQLLLDRTIGCIHATQFTGHIPRSKSLPHRHLYEEALLVLSGEGVLWTETARTKVAAGDVIFFPRKQIHSLQATAEAGMDIVGVIHPGDNPGVSY